MGIQLLKNAKKFCPVLGSNTILLDKLKLKARGSEGSSVVVYVKSFEELVSNGYNGCNG
ncbi:hypothetical protein CAL7716_054570 [Calothrix sp. PCC 7716]|nr:hypothetical protein CAL7716_054570 [Calothrix sp. PCC 7716]